ncbi:MAG: 16S rRNA (cytosine(1402)-N(4))-methyltransferase RsmH [Sedimentisphaerales bacterium]|nr:16S rRNA (cytosine(1402)-N(4))-methyltransferase RsmH [Sedimentisphaerales bacterium]MBN2842167.1 16S rRNA (cytosine(1402)-N(4))-methyltransferase RsmH [Sedimentisphaerales bacterium]
MAKPHDQFEESENDWSDEDSGTEKVMHIPVLLNPILEFLDCPDNATIIDCTVGQAGHSRALAERLSPAGHLYGIDVDTNSLARANENLSGVSCSWKLLHSNFGRISQLVSENNIGLVDIILADLGFSSAQIQDPSRGMSFLHDGPLDMRLSGAEQPGNGGHLNTAADLVNRLGEKELADIIFQYGEERKSRQIASAIVERRRVKRFERTGELAELVAKVVGFGPRDKYRKRKPIHPATRTFQALRIAVNDELGQLERLLKAAPEMLAPGGKIAIISFHSLEDRIVKNDFREKKQLNIYEIMTKKPIIADEAEMASNPRSRSAKLRVARRLAE